MATKKRYHLLEIEFTLHRGLDINGTRSITLTAINDWITKLYPDSKIQITNNDPEDLTMPMGISISGLTSTTCAQANWWLLKRLSTEGWEVIDIEYVTPSNIFYWLRYSY